MIKYKIRNWNSFFVEDQVVAGYENLTLLITNISVLPPSEIWTDFSLYDVHDICIYIGVQAFLFYERNIVGVFRIWYFVGAIKITDTVGRLVGYKKKHFLKKYIARYLSYSIIIIILPEYII